MHFTNIICHNNIIDSNHRSKMWLCFLAIYDYLLGEDINIVEYEL